MTDRRIINPARGLEAAQSVPADPLVQAALDEVERYPRTTDSAVLPFRAAQEVEDRPPQQARVIPVVSLLHERAPSYEFDWAQATNGSTDRIRVYREGSGLFYEATGTAKTLIDADGANPRVKPAVGFVLVTYQQGASVRYAPWDPAVPGSLSFASIGSGTLVDNLWDVGGSSALPAPVMVLVTGANELNLRGVDAAGIGGTGTFAVTAAPDTDIACAVESASTSPTEATTRVVWLSSNGTVLATRRFFHSGGADPDTALGTEQTVTLPETATHIAVVHDTDDPGAPAEQARIAVLGASGVVYVYTVTDASGYQLQYTIAADTDLASIEDPSSRVLQFFLVGSDARYTVRAADGSIIHGPVTLLSSASRPRLLPGRSVVYLTDHDTFAMKRWALDPSEPTHTENTHQDVGTIIRTEPSVVGDVFIVAETDAGDTAPDLICYNAIDKERSVSDLTTDTVTAICCAAEAGDRQGNASDPSAPANFTARVAWLASNSSTLETTRAGVGVTPAVQSTPAPQALELAVELSPIAAEPARAIVAASFTDGTLGVYEVTSGGITAIPNERTVVLTEDGSGVSYRVEDPGPVVMVPDTLLAAGAATPRVEAAESFALLGYIEASGVARMQRLSAYLKAPFAVGSDGVTTTIGYDMAARDGLDIAVRVIAIGTGTSLGIRNLVETLSFGSFAVANPVTGPVAVAVESGFEDDLWSGGRQIPEATMRVFWASGNRLATRRYFSSSSASDAALGTEQSVILPATAQHLAAVPTSDASRALVGVKLQDGGLRVYEATDADGLVLLYAASATPCDYAFGVRGLEVGDTLSRVLVRLRDGGVVATARLDLVDWSATRPDHFGRAVGESVELATATSAGDDQVEELALAAGVVVGAGDRFRVCVAGQGAPDRAIVEVQRAAGTGRTLLIPAQGLEAVTAGAWVADEDGNLVTDTPGAIALFAVPGLRVGETLSGLSAHVRDAGASGKVRVELLVATTPAATPAVAASADSAGTGAVETVPLSVSRFVLDGERYQLRVTALGTLEETRVLDLFAVSLT